MEDARKRAIISGRDRCPLGEINKSSTPSKTSSTPSKNKVCSNSKQSTPLNKEEVEATDKGRASVEKLSQWLTNESAKKQHTVRSNASNIAPPVRFRIAPKLKKEDVQATDDKRVSVKTLSSWMSDDPFEQKKLRHFRSGAKVIQKSRVFEPTQLKNIAMNIEAGSVHTKQALLEKAFKTENANDGAKRSLPSTEVRPYQLKKQKESPKNELMSVKEKKEWLTNAFKHNGVSDNHDILTSKSVEKASVSTKVSIRETAVLKSASVDDNAMFCSKDHQPTECEEVEVRNQVQTDDEECNIVSVADRAKWLKGAFNKK